MIASIPPLAILLEKGPAMFAFDFGRYLVAASVTSAVVWGLRRSSIAAFENSVKNVRMKRAFSRPPSFA